MPETQPHQKAGRSSRSRKLSQSSAVFPGEKDPSASRERSSALSGPVIVMFIGVVSYALYEAASLPEVAAFLRPLHAAGRSSDASAHGFSDWLPVVLVLFSATALLCLAVGALLRGRSSQPPAEATPVIVPAPAARIVARRHDAAPTAKGSEPKPFLIARQEARHTAQEDLRLRRDEHASAVARAAAADRLLTIVPNRTQHLFDSTPTLPVHPHIRRRDPRLGLPPGLAAALKKQVEAGPRVRQAQVTPSANVPATASV